MTAMSNDALDTYISMMNRTNTFGPAHEFIKLRTVDSEELFAISWKNNDVAQHISELRNIVGEFVKKFGLIHKFLVCIDATQAQFDSIVRQFPEYIIKRNKSGDLIFRRKSSY